MDSAGFQQAVNTALNTLQPTGQFDPMNQVIKFDPSMFQAPALNDLITKAYNALAPYYTQLIQQANGDYNVVIQQLKQQTDLTTRQAAEDYAQTIKQSNENLDAALKTLGLQFPQETQQLLDSLNKRGIAVTQDATQPGGLATAKAGESGYEMGNLTSDQALRKEAVQRSAQQQQDNAALSQKQTTEKAAMSQSQGTTSAQQSLRNTLQGYATQRQSTALSEAQAQSQADISAQQLKLQQQQMQNAGGGGAGQRPANPRPGQFIAVDTRQNGYRWNGNSWEVVQ